MLSPTAWQFIMQWLQMYVLLPKISENLLIITWILTLSPNFHHHLWSSHLGLVYNDSSNFAIFGSTHWSLPALACLVPVVILFDLFNGYETPPIQPEFHFREQADITGGQVRWADRLGNSGHVFFCQEFPHEWCVQAHCDDATTSFRMRWHYPVTVQCDYKHRGESVFCLVG
jgi:hypothetical protein